MVESLTEPSRHEPGRQGGSIVVLDIIKIMAMAMDHMMGRLGRREIVFPLKPTLVVVLLTGEEVGLPPKKEKKESKKLTAWW